MIWSRDIYDIKLYTIFARRRQDVSLDGRIILKLIFGNRMCLKRIRLA
jgi:hypothetical protein